MFAGWPAGRESAARSTLSASDSTAQSVGLARSSSLGPLDCDGAGSGSEAAEGKKRFFSAHAPAMIPPRRITTMRRATIRRRRKVRGSGRSEEHTSELQSRGHLVCRLLLEKKK